jgi:SAM-dependent methyltransferase
VEPRIAGHVEQVFTHHVIGWAAHLDAANDVVVRLNCKGEILSRTLPAFSRPDVSTALNVTCPAGFYLAQQDVRELLLNGAFIEAGTDQGGFVPLEPVAGAFQVKPNRYQDFVGDEAGDSKSQEKLEALQLAFLDRFQGRQARVLDLGCNEGFFCDAVARRLDAGYVLGVDSDLEYIERARARYPAFEFRHGSWWQSEEDEFDIILLLSAVHYEKDQAGLFQFLSRKLRPGGVLILECGIADALLVHPKEKWVIDHRPDGLFRYPTYHHLVTTLLAPLSVKYIEKSVAQAGDPVARHVLHCWSKFQDVILLSGKSGRGKTALARSLGQSPDVQTIHTDLLILRLLTDPYLESSGLAIRLRRFFEWPVDIGLVQRYLSDHGLVEDYLDLLILAVDQDFATVVIEGEYLDDPAFFDALSRRLTAEARSWHVI